MNRTLSYIIGRIGSDLAPHIADFLNRMQQIDATEDYFVENATYYAIDEEPRIEIMSKVLPLFFWDNRCGVIRNFLKYYLAARPASAMPATSITSVLRLSEMSASNAVLTPEFLVQARDKIARIPSAAVSDGMLRHLVYGVEQRQNNRQLNVVSVGSNCVPWDLVNHWYVRKEENLPFLNGPFDLAAHSPTALVHIATKNAADYLDPSCYIKVKTENNAEFALHKPTRTAFNHHLSPYWLENSFARLMAFQLERLEIFLAGLKRDDTFYLYCLSRPVTENELRTTHDELARCVNGFERLVERKMLILQTDPSLSPGTMVLSDHWRIARIPRPSEDYVWYAPLSYTSREGIAFEQAVIEALYGLVG